MNICNHEKSRCDRCPKCNTELVNIYCSLCNGFVIGAMKVTEPLRQITNDAVHFEKPTIYKEAEQYITSDGTGPMVNPIPVGAGGMVYCPPTTHPLEEENQRLKEENERLAKWVDSQCKTMDALREEIAILRKRHGYREEK